MTLAQVFEGQFRGDIRFRGAAYLKTERVSITRVTPQSVFAVVQDGIDYQTQLTREGTELRMFCSCTQSDRPSAPCKHLWATILAVDARGLIAGAIKPGNVPPFAVEAPPEIAFDDYWEGDPYRDVYSPPAGGRSARVPLVYQPPVKAWESQLRKLSETLHIEATGAATAAREREIFYEIDVTQSRERSLLVIQTSQRQRRSNGQWGKRKALKLRPGQLEDIDLDDDRRILSYLAGGAPERTTNWMAQQVEGQTTAHRYQVTSGLAEVLLPLLCATHRTVLLGDDSERVRPLEWDEGPAWELCVEVASDESAENWLLAGS